MYADITGMQIRMKMLFLQLRMKKLKKHISDELQLD